MPKVEKTKKIKEPKEYLVSVWNISGERVQNIPTKRYFVTNKENFKKELASDFENILMSIGYLTEDMKIRTRLKPSSKGKPRKELTDDDYIMKFTTEWGSDKIIKGTYYFWINQCECFHCVVEDLDTMCMGDYPIVGFQ